MQSDSRWHGGTVQRLGTARIIEFKPRPRSGKRRRTPPIIDPLRQFESHEYRLRMQQNLLAILVLSAILGAGLWLFHELTWSSRALLCLEAEHRNCVPIDQRGMIK
jgi:hypothetical protein